jgi:hypothetical protein
MTAFEQSRDDGPANAAYQYPEMSDYTEVDDAYWPTLQITDAERAVVHRFDSTDRKLVAGFAAATLTSMVFSHQLAEGTLQLVQQLSTIGSSYEITQQLGEAPHTVSADSYGSLGVTPDDTHVALTSNLWGTPGSALNGLEAAHLGSLQSVTEISEVTALGFHGLHG